ncbi:hypothetical protein FAGKG844_190025 [Frankia sp. AgKG'84/4]
MSFPTVSFPTVPLPTVPLPTVPLPTVPLPTAANRLLSACPPDAGNPAGARMHAVSDMTDSRGEVPQGGRDRIAR